MEFPVGLWKGLLLLTYEGGDSSQPSPRSTINQQLSPKNPALFLTFHVDERFKSQFMAPRPPLRHNLQGGLFPAHFGVLCLSFSDLSQNF